MAELFAMLRSEPELVAQDILRRIRLGNDVRTVLSEVNAVDEQSQEIGDLYDLSDPTITSRHLPFQRQNNIELREGFESSAPNLPEKIVDSLIKREQVEALQKDTGFHVWPGVAKRWTRLTDSDALVSHLMHCYYEHQVGRKEMCFDRNANNRCSSGYVTSTTGQYFCTTLQMEKRVSVRSCLSTASWQMHA